MLIREAIEDFTLNQQILSRAERYIGLAGIPWRSVKYYADERSVKQGLRIDTEGIPLSLTAILDLAISVFTSFMIV